MIYFNYLSEFLLITITAFLYCKTLEGCYESEAICTERYRLNMIKYALMLILTSAFMFSMHVFGCFMKYFSKFSIFISSILIFYLCFIYDTGNDFKSLRIRLAEPLSD